MYVNINNMCYSWISAVLDSCCGIRDACSLDVSESNSPLRASSWDTQLAGDFPDFVSAFLYWCSRDRFNLFCITDRKDGEWDTNLFSKLGKYMELELANGTIYRFKCTFSGWHRNPNTRRLVQLVTIAKDY